MSDDFPAAIKQALDQYQVPPLPAGFSDRLMIRLANQGDATIPAILHSAATPPPRTRAIRRTGPWGRSGKILTTITAFSLATATAAASGFLGEPTYVPVISQLLASTKLVADPRSKAPPPPKIVAIRPLEPLKTQTTSTIDAPTTQGTRAVIDRLEALKRDAAYIDLPPRERLVLARGAVFTAVRSGEATPEEARAALQEIAKNADPAAKVKWQEVAKVRQAKREAVHAATQERRADKAAANPAATDVTLQPQAATLRQRLRDASPEERAAFWKAVRERKQARPKAETP